MGNKIKKVIESEIQELVFGRLSTIDAGAAKSISKVVRASSKEIAKKFIKVISKEQKKNTSDKPTRPKAKVASTKTNSTTIKRKSAPKKTVSTPRKGKK
ncbi:MAG: hypothetical protein ACKOX7_02035 [Bacteroidota bacterium]